MEKKSRLPRVHLDTLLEVSRELGPQPRFSIAKELQRRTRVLQKTALDYVNSAVNEGVLRKVGMNLIHVDLTGMDLPFGK